MGAHHFLYDRQAEACSCRSAIFAKTFENRLFQPWRYARALITDTQHNFGAIYRAMQRDGTLAVQYRVLQQIAERVA